MYLSGIHCCNNITVKVLHIAPLYLVIALKVITCLLNGGMRERIGIIFSSIIIANLQVAHRAGIIHG